MIEAPVLTGADETDVAIETGGGIALTTRTPETQSKRRFITAVLIGIAAVSVPYLWVLFDLWTGKINGLRSVAPDNFYELQARGMFAGHFYVPTGSLGIEGFLHAGRTYTYFGIWPSIIRMPILVFSFSMPSSVRMP